MRVEVICINSINNLLYFCLKRWLVSCTIISISWEVNAVAKMPNIKWILYKYDMFDFFLLTGQSWIFNERHMHRCADSWYQYLGLRLFWFGYFARMGQNHKHHRMDQRYELWIKYATRGKWLDKTALIRVDQGWSVRFRTVKSSTLIKVQTTLQVKKCWILPEI